MTRWARSTFVVLLASVIAVVSGCSQGSSGSSRSGGDPGPVAVASAGPGLPGVRALSRTYRLTPSGSLARPQKVRLPLNYRVPAGWAIVVATAETARGPWTYLPAKLGPDRNTAIFTTTHHSFFTVIGENLANMLRFFKKEFLDGLSSGVTATASRPSCGDQAAARSGYTIKSSSGPTVYWCFGLKASGARILRVVNDRPYPLEVEHAGLAVAEKPSIDYSSLASLSHAISRSLSILAPGAQIGYSLSLAPGRLADVQTQLDGFGQSLFALQTGINAMLAILTRFGAGGASKGVTVLNDALGDEACGNALFAGNPGSILASCLSPKEMFGYFGPAGFLLAPLAAAGGITEFFVSEFQSLHDIFTSEDEYQILVRQAAVPVLGLVSSDPFQTGFGTAQPSRLSLGDGPFGVSDLRWQSWGGSQATGTGTAGIFMGNPSGTYTSPSPATVVAFDLGTCGGKLVYQALEWYFRQHGQTFNPDVYFDTCTHLLVRH